MPIPTEGYIQTSRNLGGFGKATFNDAPDFGCRLAMTVTGATPDGESYIALGGFRIGTGTFSGRRALYTYSPTMASPTLERTVWKGIQVEVAEEGGERAFVYNDGSILIGLPAFAANELTVGGGIISIDTDGKILCLSKGVPEETSQATIGSKRMTVGRFGDVWALAVHPVPEPI